MGLWDKVKSAKNFITGGGATVTLQVGQAQLGAPIPVLVQASVADAPLSVARVYIIARAEESIRMTVRDRDDPGDRDRVSENNDTFRQEFPITGPLQLEANSQHEWQGQIQLPESCQPTYVGHHANHTWKFQAGLDVKGNDPDSGWIEVHIR